MTATANRTSPYFDLRAAVGMFCAVLTEWFPVRRSVHSTDIPAQGDFDGDGKTDLAVFRSGIWYLHANDQRIFRRFSSARTAICPSPAITTATIKPMFQFFARQTALGICCEARTDLPASDLVLQPTNRFRMLICRSRFLRLLKLRPKFHRNFLCFGALNN